MYSFMKKDHKAGKKAKGINKIVVERSESEYIDILFEKNSNKKQNK